MEYVYSVAGIRMRAKVQKSETQETRALSH